MFSIYDYDRRVFRNTLEELYKVNPILSSSQPGNNKDIQFTEDKSFQPEVEYIPSSSSINTYKELVNINQKDQIYHAYQVMDPFYEYVYERSSVVEVLKKMRFGGFDILPVLTTDKRVVGLFTYDLIFKKLSDIDLGIKSVMMNPVKGFIEEQVITADPVTSIRRIAEVMYNYNLRVMPIVDAHETVIGIVSYREVLNAISNDPPMSLWT